MEAVAAPDICKAVEGIMEEGEEANGFEVEAMRSEREAGVIGERVDMRLTFVL